LTVSGPERELALWSAHQIVLELGSRMDRAATLVSGADAKSCEARTLNLNCRASYDQKGYELLEHDAFNLRMSRDVSLEL
jgi:hypothetical protein